MGKETADPTGQIGRHVLVQGTFGQTPRQQVGGGHGAAGHENHRIAPHLEQAAGAAEVHFLRAEDHPAVWQPQRRGDD